MKLGTRDPFNLMLNCRRMLPTGVSKLTENWMLAAQLFSVGQASAVSICKEAEIDPRGIVVTKVPS